MSNIILLIFVVVIEKVNKVDFIFDLSIWCEYVEKYCILEWYDGCGEIRVVEDGCLF